ncbi:MAG: hypothetical protein QNM02_11745 [Acidimicrobiia bacterium]|nr:hypothetical protein [Acidimicrobiia bacterium]
MADQIPIHVELQEGFVADRVEVVIGGERSEFAELSTRNQVGLAEVIDVHVMAGPIVVRVALPDRSVEGRSEHRLSREAWLAVNLVAGDVEFRWSDEPFFYA